MERSVKLTKKCNFKIELMMLIINKYLTIEIFLSHQLQISNKSEVNCLIAPFPAVTKAFFMYDYSRTVFNLKRKGGDKQVIFGSISCPCHILLTLCDVISTTFLFYL